MQDRSHVITVNALDTRNIVLYTVHLTLSESYGIDYCGVPLILIQLAQYVGTYAIEKHNGTWTKPFFIKYWGNTFNKQTRKILTDKFVFLTMSTLVIQYPILACLFMSNIVKVNSDDQLETQHVYFINIWPGIIIFLCTLYITRQ